MHFLFVDESGSPDSTDPTLLFTLVGVAFHIEEYKKFSGFFNNVKHSFYPEIMNKPLTMTPKIDKLIREQQELKGILKPTNFNKRDERFMKVILNYCINNVKVSIHPVIFLKNELNNTPNGTWIYPLAFKRLIKSFNNFLLNKQANGLVILDSRDPGSDDKLVASFYSHTARDPFGITCNNVIGPPLFARSHITYGLQLAHHIAYLTFGKYFHSYYDKKGGEEFKHVAPFWSLISNSETLYGSPNNLKGIIVWE